MSETPCIIPLTKGFTAQVDWEDVALLEVRWCVSINRSGKPYAVRQASSGREYLHRRIMGNPPEGVDHRNGDTLDCRRGNLIVGNLENAWNKPTPTTNTSGYLGVSFHRPTGKWWAKIIHKGVTHSLGTYNTPEEANIARLLKEKELWGIQPRREHIFKEAGL